MTERTSYRLCDNCWGACYFPCEDCNPDGEEQVDREAEITHEMIIQEIDNKEWALGIIYNRAVREVSLCFGWFEIIFPV